MKELFNDLGKKVNEVVGQISKKTEPLMKKTEDVVEVQKIKAQIRTLYKNNEYDLSDLGEIVFAKYKDELIEDEDFVAICEEIEQRLDAIEELEKQVVSLKGMCTCDECEMSVDKEAAFCPNCGAKIVHEEEPTEDVSEVEEVYFEEGDVVEAFETEDDEIEIELVVESEEVEIAEEIEETEETEETEEV
ncbi:MAG: zinc ribbon domain-containing protein [Eubacteriales bacterium]